MKFSIRHKIIFFFSLASLLVFSALGAYIGFAVRPRTMTQTRFAISQMVESKANEVSMWVKRMAVEYRTIAAIPAFSSMDVREITPERHDAIIAYTSQLMHIVALSVCDDADLFQCKGYEGSSFRDVTRVAALDPDMWTDLMSMNAPALSQVIRRLEENIHAYRIALDNRDRDRLHAKLTYSSTRKRRINLPGSGQVPLDRPKTTTKTVEPS